MLIRVKNIIHAGDLAATLTNQRCTADGSMYPTWVISEIGTWMGHCLRIQGIDQIGKSQKHPKRRQIIPVTFPRKLHEWSQHELLDLRASNGVHNESSLSNRTEYLKLQSENSAQPRGYGINQDFAFQDQ